MNLDKLKPAWRQYKLANSMDRLERQDILSMIEIAEPSLYPLSKLTLVNAMMLALLTVCCQGG